MKVMIPQTARLGAAAAIVLVAVVPAAADRPPQRGEVEEIHLLLHPAEAPVPALEIQLLPPLLEQAPGNAALLYGKAFLLMSQVDLDEEGIDRVAQWLERPLDDMPPEEVIDTLDPFHDAVHYAEMAARRSRCDWQMPIHEEENIYGFLLPELSAARNLGRVIAVRARLHIARHDYGAALECLQTGYAMSRHVAEQPVIVSGLVGLAIAETMTDQVQEVIQRPDVPNLYWSLTAMPRPMIDLNRALRLESVGIYLLFPEFEEAKRHDLPPEHWRGLLGEIIERIRSFSETAEGERPQQIDLDELIRKVYPAARRELLERRRWFERERREIIDRIDELEQEIRELHESGEHKQAEELQRHLDELREHAEPGRDIEDMSPPEVVATHIFETYDELRDEMFKWFYVPYWQAQEAMHRAETQLREAAGRREVVPLAGMFLPAVSRCRFVAVRFERRIAALRCVEAIRLYAALHDGRLPGSLEEIKEVPLPINPVTGKPFPYHLDGETAVLESEGGPADRPSLRYVIRLAEPAP